MKKKLSVRLLSVLMCLVMMFVCLQASASALSPDDLQQAIDKLAYYTMANLPDGIKAHLNEGWSRAKLDTADAEQLNLLTTIDPDGTKTLYSYDTPINMWMMRDISALSTAVLSPPFWPKAWSIGTLTKTPPMK